MGDKKRLKKTVTLKAQQILLCFNALFWIIALVSWLSRYYGISGVILYSVIMPTLMALNIIGFLILAVLIRKQKESIYLITEVYVTVNFVLSITDQMGWVDMCVLLLNLITFVVVAVSLYDDKYEEH